MSNNQKSRNSAKDQDVMKVDFRCLKNNTDHHTNEITVERLIIRRGQPFSVTLAVERQQQDYIELTAETGPDPSVEKGTRCSFNTRRKCGTSVGKSWSVSVMESSPSSVTLSVLCPSDASIGVYSLAVITGSNTTAVRCLGTLTVLFNPWCEDDWVYLPNDAERQEYVMNEHGIVYKGVGEYITTLAWDFGQFEDDILDICLKLLDLNPKCLKDAQEDISARCNPIYISRVVSTMINCDDDKGVLMGQWDGTYIGGIIPSHWSSSVEILRRWKKYGCYPVKYGQCWVFAAVMCTVMRCLGIPCRVVTNYESAHDTDQNLIVDEYFGDYGVKPKRNMDSVWNYHVWVEGWMRRPDLSEDSFYDGWQVLDPTPQEKSSGTYCCGPAPVKAICEGHTNVKYDIPFVFGEVNADKVTWLLMANGTKKKIQSDTKTVGQSISTKAVGCDKRQDITKNYKHPEGSVEERVAYEEAVKRVTELKISEAPPPPNINMKIELDGKPLNGVDIKLNLIVKSVNSKAQALSLKMNAQIMRYTGNPTEAVWSDNRDIQLTPKQEQTIPVTIPFSAYGQKLQDNNCIKVSVIAMDKTDPKEIFLVDRDIVPHNPTLNLTVTGTPLVNSEMTAEVMFENPLAVPLKNCCVTLTGSGLLKQTEENRIAELAAGQKGSLKVKFRPYRAGPKTLVANFDSSTFKDLKSSCDVNIRPSTARSGYLTFGK
ncbi:protein-glutamine gamma-glutamyltransferase 2 [Xyrauchen texanus]|uniref:protein-glutamine gamma-glutamyltransferase 2 n=1 Tax=Xyrauchen texanus TaxID=154827 RepID=UPI0022418862|nr:protein-glutamine gamma-glutamyltransferase 2 [Xyrauchen texanus]